MDTQIKRLSKFLGLSARVTRKLNQELEQTAIRPAEVAPLATLAKTRPDYRPKLAKMLTQYTLGQTLIVYYMAGVLPTSPGDQESETKYYWFFSEELCFTFIEEMAGKLKSSPELRKLKEL